MIYASISKHYSSVDLRNQLFGLKVDGLKHVRISFRRSFEDDCAFCEGFDTRKGIFISRDSFIVFKVGFELLHERLRFDRGRFGESFGNISLPFAAVVDGSPLPMDAHGC
jgi:hypothetical protein